MGDDCELEVQVERFFSDQGPLAKRWAGYEPRNGQIQMAKAIAKNFTQGGALVAEAGTGIGKSFAYLVPAVLAKGKGPVVISTGTHTLQAQLMEKDIPAIAQLLKRPLKAVLAIGRSNYLCKTRFERVAPVAESYAEDEDDIRAIPRIRALSNQAPIVKRADLPVQVSDAFWTQINSESGICSAAQCRECRCSYSQARKELDGADIIVVNHALLFSHLALAQKKVFLLPRFQILVLDEAHHCPDIATERFGVALSNGQVRFFLERLLNRKGKGFLATVKPDPTRLKALVTQLKDNYMNFFYELDGWLKTDAPPNGRLREPYAFADILSPAFEELAEMLENWAGSAEQLEEAQEFRYHAQRAQGFFHELAVFKNQLAPNSAYWAASSGAPDGGRKKISANVAPLDVSDDLRRWLFDGLHAVVMTSATLTSSAKKPFEFFRRRMGVPSDGVEIRLESPFDFKEKSILLSYTKMPAPREAGYEEAIEEKVKHCIDLSEGGVFVLVTSFAMLRRLYEHLYSFAEKRNYPLYAQGLNGNRSTLLARFRQEKHPILIGNHSFWEGVDVPGRSLRNVIITKLPFEIPSHPLQEARHEKLQASGGNPFKELSLPQAIMGFRQGFGRLLRRSDDRGLVCVLDNRLHTRPYGREFLAALPPSKVLIDADPDEAFLKKLRDWYNHESEL